MHYLVYLLLAGLLTACATHIVRAPVGDHSQHPGYHPDIHIVRQGDTLYSVAFMYRYPVDRLARWNGLKPPYTIYKGQRLRLMPPAGRIPVVTVAATGASAINPSRPKPRALVSAKPGSVSRPAHAPVPKDSPRPSVASRPNAPARNRWSGWKWPVSGRLLQRYQSEGSGRNGIAIAGRSGDPVHAAASGKVVYAGSGLGGYGKLIIIKHNKDFLSAYAHNRKLMAREGQWVKQGQVIARMGHSGTDRVQLHFEIRKHGRPVNPLRYLPRRR